jgi:hypothetical protein
VVVLIRSLDMLCQSLCNWYKMLYMLRIGKGVGFRALVLSHMSFLLSEAVLRINVFGIMDSVYSVFKDYATEVRKQDALKALTEVIIFHNTDLKESDLAGQLDTLLESLQLFSADTMPREQFERALKENVQLYKQLSQVNASLTTDGTWVHLHSFPFADDVLCASR